MLERSFICVPEVCLQTPLIARLIADMRHSKAALKVIVKPPLVVHVVGCFLQFGVMSVIWCTKALSHSITLAFAVEHQPRRRQQADGGGRMLVKLGQIFQDGHRTKSRR